MFREWGLGWDPTGSPIFCVTSDTRICLQRALLVGESITAKKIMDRPTDSYDRSTGFPREKYIGDLKKGMRIAMKIRRRRIWLQTVVTLYPRSPGQESPDKLSQLRSCDNREGKKQLED